MNKKYLLMLMLMYFSIVSFAQKNKADKAFRLNKYSDAVRYYKKHLKSNATDYTAWKNLAKSYEFINEPSSAYNAYKSLVRLQDVQAEDFYNAAKNCLELNKHNEGLGYANQYESRKPGQGAQFLKASINGRNGWLESGKLFSVISKTTKHRTAVMSAVPYGNTYIVSAENTKKPKSNWKNSSYIQLFITDENMMPQKVLFSGRQKLELDEAIATFEPGQNVIYFTETFANGKLEGNVKTRRLKIQSGRIDNGEFVSTNSFPYNSENYNSAHPTISPDGNYLVFSSNRSGGKGKMDLFLCKKQSGSWSSPQALNTINTFGNEIFPKFISNSELSFTSDALPGLGGMDIFISSFNNGTVEKSINPGAPINSSFDDFSLLSDDINVSGYVTSNRFHGNAKDEILYFSKKAKEVPIVKEKPKQANKKLTVLVLDKFTSQPLPGVDVSIKKVDGSIWKTGKTDAEGKLKINSIPDGLALKINGTFHEIKTTNETVGQEDYNSGDPVIFKKLIHNDPRFTLIGKVRERKSRNPVAGVQVKLDNESQGKSSSELSKNDGGFKFQLEQNSNFTVKGVKNGIFSNNHFATTKGLDRTTTLYAKLVLNVDIICIGSEIPIEDIYYDYDKSNIRSDAKKSLNNLVALLNQYPDMKIELGSHTDKRGSAEYNRKLAQRRAESAVSYIVSRGIASGRIVAKGYGEDKLKTVCEPCSDNQHQSNRRTEVRILSCPSCPSCD